MSDFLDQTPLLDLAERLVSAARRAGADAADAVAVRSISLSVEVREGAVEESERAEGDDMGLRVLVGKRQAVVSTNDTKGNGADALARSKPGALLYGTGNAISETATKVGNRIGEKAEEVKDWAKEKLHKGQNRADEAADKAENAAEAAKEDVRLFAFFIGRGVA